MTFTVLETKYRWDRVTPARSRKKFVDGKEEKLQKGQHAKFYSPTCQYIGDDPLPKIYDQLLRIEKANTDELIIAEKLLTNEPIISLTQDTYIERDVRRNWVQLDFDQGFDGCNALTLQKRLTAALAALPEHIGSCELVAQLSNKAGLSTYPNYMGLRIYLALDEPATNAELRQHLKALPCDMIYSNGRKHLAGLPIVEGSVERADLGETVLYREGCKFSIKELHADPEYKKKLTLCNAFTTEIKNVKASSSAGSTSIEGLIELAELGYFDMQGVQRHTEHWQILKAAELVNQNGQQVIDAIVASGRGPGTILGSKTRENLDTQLKQIQDKIRESYIYDMGLQEFDFIANDPKTHDLKNADLSSFRNKIVESLVEKKQTAIIARVPHGGSKTSVLVPLCQEAFEDANGKKPSVLYVCTLRSIIRNVSKKLLLACYIDKNGEIHQEVIENATDLGICIKSIKRLKKKFDVVIVDESESVGLWAAWYEHNSHDVASQYGHLISLLSEAKLFLLADADAADMTYSLMARAVERESVMRMLLQTSDSWIAAQDQTMYLCEDELTVKYKLYEYAITQDKMCFVHASFADSPANPDMTAFCNAYNAIAGRRIAVGWDSNTPKHIKSLLFNHPEKYIDALYAKGVRIFVVSPIIVSGWRYNGKNTFDASFGIYKGFNQTALDIVQRTQRVVACLEHFVYVTKRASWTDTEILEQDALNEVGYLDFMGLIGEHTLKSLKHDVNGYGLVSQAITKQERLRDNIRLHLIHYWQDFGGNLEVWNYTEEVQAGLEALNEILKSEKERASLIEASRILSDPERLEKFLSGIRHYGANREWNNCPTPRTPEGMAKLLKKIEGQELNYKHTQLLSQLLASDENEWRLWMLNGHPLITLEGLVETGEDFNPSTLAVLGTILREIEEQLDLGDYGTILSWIYSNGRPLVINTGDWDTTEIKALIERYQDILKSQHKPIFGRGITDPAKILCNVFRACFGCSVQTSQPKEVVKNKKALVASYAANGTMPKNTDANKRQNQKAAISKLERRIKAGLELSEVEQNFVDNSGIFITISPPGKMLWKSLSMIKGLEESRKQKDLIQRLLEQERYVDLTQGQELLELASSS